MVSGRLKYQRNLLNPHGGVIDDKASNNEVSFVLERKTTDSTGSNSPGKLGLFTIALVMCVCCFSSFFTPVGSDSAIIQGGMRHNAIPGIGGKSLMFASENQDGDASGGETI